MGWMLRSAVVGVLVGMFLQWPSPRLPSEVIEWKQKGHYLDYQGHDIFYRDDSGDPWGTQTLLIIHGFPSSSYDWVKVWPDLLENFNRVIAPDMFGSGFSDKPSDRIYTLVEQADIIEALLEKLQVTKIHILAHDYGDTVAQELLHRFNNREHTTENKYTIESLCLTNGGIFPETNFPSFFQKVLVTPVVGPVLARFTTYPLFKMGFGRVFGPNTQPSAEEMMAFWAIRCYNYGYLAVPGLLHYMDQRWQNRERWVGALQQTKVPVHTIYGDADVINPPGFVDHYRSLIPKPSISVMEGVGHYPQFEAPEQLMDHYRQFLDSL